MLHHVKWKHPYYTWNRDVINGGTLTDIHNSLPKDSEVVSAFDVTVIICNVNTPKGKKGPSVFAPGSDQGIAMMRLCMELRRHKRAVLVVGGTGHQWNMKEEEAWDAMVSQLIGVAHSMGTMAIDGQKYYDRMKSCPDGWHFLPRTRRHQCLSRIRPRCDQRGLRGQAAGIFRGGAATQRRGCSFGAS